MRFLVDNQLPKALARWLSAHGHEAVHVLDIGMAQTPDAEICAYAANESRVVVSKDEDFLSLVLRPGVTVQLVWVRMPNCTNAELLTAFAHALEQAVSILTSGQQIVELR